jgi:hypothetical protein
VTDYRRLVEEENPYLDLVRQGQNESLRSAMYGAAQTNPDVEADLRKLAEKVNVPVETVRIDRKEIERQAILGEVDYDGLIKDAPVTANFLSEQADVARDDVSVLTRIDRTFRAIGQGWKQGSVQDRVEPLNWRWLSGEILSPSEQEERRKLLGEMQALGKTVERGDNPVSWFLGQTGYTGRQLVSSVREGAKGAIPGAVAGAGAAALIGQLGPQVALPEELVTVPGGFFFGGRAGFITATTVYNYKAEAGFAFAEYEQMRDESGQLLDPAVARGAAAAAGLLNAGLETVGDIALAKMIPGLDRLVGAGSREAIKTLLARPTFRNAIAQAGKKWLTAASVEGVTESLQELGVILGRELAQGVSGQEFAPEAAGSDLMRVLESGAAGFAGGAGVGLPGAAISTVSNVREVRKANQTQQFMRALGEAAGESKLRERLPQTFQDYVARIREQGPVENVFIPADQFTQYWQSQNVDPEQIANEVGATNYAEAVATGSDVVIPIETYATRLAPTQHHNGLMKDVRLAQGDLTMREVEALEARRTEIETEIQTMMEQEGVETETPAIGQIKQDVLGQLLGRFDRATADNYATLYSRAINSLAQRGGMDPMELHRQYGLQVVTPLPDILQARAGVDTALDPLIDRLRSGDIPSRREIYGKSLAEFLRERGGVQDQGGELSARDAKLWDRDNRRVGEKALVSDKGMSFDEARELALEAGFEVGETEQTFLDAMDREFRGEGVFMPGKEQASLAELADALAGLEEFLGQQGIDVTTTDNATIKALIAKASEGMEGAPAMEFEQAADRLSAIHNLTAENLIYADKIGGLAVPSVAVVPQGQAIEGFGEITLLGSKRLVDPEAEPVFSADAYSATFPKPEYRKVKAATAMEVAKRFRAFDERYSDSVEDVIVDYSVSKPDPQRIIDFMLRSRSAMAAYLQSTGESVPSPVMRAVDLRVPFVTDPQVKEFVERSGYAELLNMRPEESPDLWAQFSNIVADAASRYATESSPDNPDVAATLRESIESRLFRDGALTYNGLAAVLTSYRDAERSEINRQETEDALTDAIGDRKSEFKSWIESEIIPMFGQPRIKIGGKLVPYTLGNIVDAMTGAVKNVEKTFTYGSGKVRAAQSMRFRNLEQMREYAKTSIRSEKEVAKYRKEADNLLAQYRSAVIEYSKHGDTWDALDESMEAIAKGGTTQAGIRKALSKNFKVGSIPDDVIDLAVRASKSLLLAPVPYFEAKPQRAVALNEFSGAVVPSGTSKAAIDVLEKSGIQWTYYDPQSEGSREAAIADLQGQLPDTLFQAVSPEDKRGYIQFGADRKVRIGLLEKADLSTFIHETGHFYLEVLLDIAERADASPQIKADAETLMKWFGVKSRAEIGVKQHEEFARANEAYLMEGKAPSAELRTIFQRVRAWMTLVYRTLTNLNVRMNDDVRGVFDRIYATDKEIESANAELDVRDVFASAQDAGMTEAEFAAYKKTAEAAGEAAKEKLQGRLIREYQREREKWWKAERAKMLEKVTEEVDSSPAYRAAAILTEGKLPDGIAVKLSRQALENRFGSEYLKRMPRFLRKVYTKDGGTDIDTAAEMLGFESGEALMTALINLRPRKELIEAETANRMAAEFGDMRMDGTIADEAMAAIHNSERANVLKAELVAIRRLQRQVRPVVAALRREEAEQRRAGMDMVDAAMADPQAFARAAAGRIGQMMARDISPGKYLLAERRASKAAFDAIRRKDYNAAAIEKQRELLNHYMYLEARKAQQQLDRIYDYANKFDKKATRERLAKAGGGYLDQIDAILEKYEFRRVPLKVLGRRQSLVDFAEQQAALGLIVNVPDQLLDEARLVNYKNASVDELRAVYDTVRNIEHLARLKDKLLRKAAAVEFQDTKDELIKAATESDRLATTGELRIPNTVGEPLLARGAKAWRRFDAAILKVEQMVEWLDGGKINGPWARFVFDLANDAQVKEYELHAMVTKQIQDLTESMPKGWGDSLTDKVDVLLPGIESPVTRYTLISIAMNVGNDSSYQRLRDGYGWSDSSINAALGKLAKEDWDYIQGIWDAVNSLWPEIKALEERTSGVAPPKVEPRVVQTRFGDYRGGYFPLAYDPKLSAVGDKQAEATESVSQFMSNAYGRARTDRGYTKQRVENLKAAVRLDYEQVLTSHLTKVIKDISHREAIFSLNKLLKDEEIKEVMIDRLGEARYREFTKWMQVLVSDRADTLHSGNVFSRAIMQFRTNMAIVTMGWKVTTMMAQFAGIGPALDTVKPRFFTQALIDYNRFGPWSTHRETLEQFVYERSGEMKFRSDNIDRDVRDNLRKLRGEGGPLAAIRRSAFYLTAMADRQVTIPTWLGAYRQALAEGLGEEDAIRAGDRAVRLSQGAAGAKDLAAVQRDNELMKLLTMYYTPFSVLYARMRDVGATTRRVRDMPRAVARMLALVILPAVLGEILAGRGPEEDEDETWWAIRKMLLYPLASIPILKEGSGVVEASMINLTGEGEMAYQPSWRLSPVAGSIEKVGRTFMRTSDVLSGDREFNDVAWDMFESSGYIFGLPTRQVRISGEYTMDVLNDERNPESPQQFMYEVLYGPPKEQ